MNVDTPFILSITLWSSCPPVHRISAISISPNGEKLVTCSFDGQLCIWSLSFENKELLPRNILVGHEDPVTCLDCTNEYIVSTSEGGELCRWNLEDGYCFKYLRTQYLHKQIKLWKRFDSDFEWLFTCGSYAEIFIIDPFTLQIVTVLHSKSNTDWISCFEVLPSQESRDFVVGVTGSGFLKTWIVEELNEDDQYEVDSNLLPAKDIIDLKIDSLQVLCLIVSIELWYVFKICDLKLVHKYMAEEKLLGGNFCDKNIITWTVTGKFYLFELDDDGPQLIALYKTTDLKKLYEPAMSFIQFDSLKYIALGDSEGKVLLFEVSLEEKKIEMYMSSVLKDNWMIQKGIFEDLITYCTVTVCIYVSQLDKFVIGCSDGTIVTIPAVQTITAYYFCSKVEKPAYQILSCHTGKVTCLLYPHEKYSHYNKAYIISGSSDFSVCLWDIFKSQLIHKFCVHSGEVIKLIIPPENCKQRIRNSICSVSADHSVALLNLKELRCVILASRHTSPVVSINWKPLDDFIVVECFDGTVYVWQLETGHLDRILHGVTAQEVVFACNEICESIHIPDTNFYSNEKSLVGKDYLKRGYFEIGCDFSESSIDLKGFYTNKCCESHILTFNIESLISHINISLKNKPRLDLMDPVMNQKIHSLTQHVNWDVQKKISVLLDKLKHEAEVIQEKFHHNRTYHPKTTEGSFHEVEIHETGKDSVFKIAHILMSILHNWGSNSELDDLLLEKFKIFKPEIPVTLSIFSGNGMFSLFLPFNGKQASSSLVATHMIALNALSYVLEFFDEDSNQFETWRQVFSLVRKKTPKLNLEILARLWQNKSLCVRNAARSLLIEELLHLTAEDHSRLIDRWFRFLPRFQQEAEVEKMALVLMGVLGSDHKFKKCDAESQENYFRQTCNSLVYLLEEKKINFELQTIAIDLIGRGYIVWEPFLKLEKILLNLFNLCAEVYKISNSNVHDQMSPSVDKCLTAHNALKSIAIVRTNAFVSCLISEIALIKSSQVVKTDQSIIEKSKTEIILIFRFLLEKTPYLILHHLNDVITILLYCIDLSHLKQDSLVNLIPGIKRFRQVHHCVASQKVAVGLSNGVIIVHELKTNKIHSVNAHNDSITAIMFSPDGKLLASYCCFENRLCLWQVGAGIFGLGHVHVKFTKSWETSHIRDEDIRNHWEIASLSWVDNKTIHLNLCDGSQNVFTL